MGDTGLLGPERPAPSPVPSLRLELLAFRVGCCLFSVWGLLAALAAMGTATGTAKPGSAHPCVGPRPRADLLGSVWSFFPGLASGGLGVVGSPGGPGTAGCGPCVSGACPTAMGQGARPTLQREPQSQQGVSREKGAYFKELTRSSDGEAGGGGKELQFASGGRLRGLPRPQGAQSVVLRPSAGG